jgi:hypothetical protein
MEIRCTTLSYQQVRAIVSECGYASVFDHIREKDGTYTLNGPLNDITHLPSYKYALMVTLMALGNSQEASDTFQASWLHIGYGGQSDVSYMLGRLLMAIYTPA